MEVPWNLEELAIRAVGEAAYEVAVLPFGATEPHNTHLPYGTDTLEARIAGGAVCAEASRLGARVVLLDDYGPARQHASLVINALLAETLWPGQTALGRSLRLRSPDGEAYRTPPTIDDEVACTDECATPLDCEASCVCSAGRCSVSE